jgi:cellulose synthase/poly-beta-1,6-N-acetylglucosamine synthase-like glycosyltransferase
MRWYLLCNICRKIQKCTVKKMGLLFYFSQKLKFFLQLYTACALQSWCRLERNPACSVFFSASGCPVPAVASLLSFLASVGAVLQLLFCLNSRVLAVGFYFLFHILWFVISHFGILNFVSFFILIFYILSYWSSPVLQSTFCFPVSWCSTLFIQR